MFYPYFFVYLWPDFRIIKSLYNQLKMNKLALSLILFGAVSSQAAFAQSTDTLAAAQIDTLNTTPTNTLATAVERETITVKTLPGAYLNSSCGSDRLGGSKMGFICEDVVLKVAGDTGSLYKIQLSENRYAFIPKEMVADTTVEAASLAPCSSQSVSVSNAGYCDRIRIALPARKPYMIRETSHPRQLIIEVFGAQNNSNWITQYLDIQTVGNIEAVQTDSDILTFTVNLQGKSSWGYDAYYKDNSLIVDIKHTPAFSLKGMTIGVDAGHGGPKSSGAVGRNTKIKEKDLNLAMAHMLKEMLEAKGAKVVLSRSTDVEVSMAERKAIFKENNIDMMISIHCNAGGTAQGSSTYYKHIQNRELAKQILNKLLEIEGVHNFGLIGNFNFSLNAPTEYPAVLVETLFLSHAWDEAHITNPKFQKQMMKKVTEGIHDYLKYCKKAERK